MTVIDFPDAPTPGQEFTVGAMTWVFNDPLWNLKSSGSGGGGTGGPDTLGFTFTQDTVPTTTRVGDTWFDTAEGRSFIWFDGRWVQFSPGGGGGSGEPLLFFSVGGATTDNDLAAGAIIPGLTTTAPLSFKKGRKYRITANWGASNRGADTAAAIQTFGLRVGGVEVVAKSVTANHPGSWLHIVTLEHIYVPAQDERKVIDAYSQTPSYYVGSYNRVGKLIVQEVAETEGGGGGGGGGGGAATPPVWTPYTPVVSGTGLNLGTTAQAVGEWTADGDLIHWRAEIAAGGTGIAAGTGGYAITLPVPAKIGVAPAPAFQIVGKGWLYAAGGFHQVTLDGAGPARVIGVDAATQGFTAAGHILAVSGTYQAATPVNGGAGGGGGPAAPGLVVTPWTQIPLAAAWMNYDAAHPAQIRKVGDNVEIRGLVKAAIPSAVGSAINSVALGPEFLPAQADESFIQGGDRVVGMVSVFKATGLIVPAAPLTDAFVYLSGIRYSTVA
jgi:hypothetical protein